MLSSPLARPCLGPGSRIVVFAVALVLGTFLLSWPVHGQPGGPLRYVVSAEAG